MTTTMTKRDAALDELSINTIRTLSMDAVQRANSGHPGTPMALAPLAYLLWTEHLRYDPSAPDWMGRDRFILSAGHASMLLYSLLHLTGFEVSLEDLKNFRQWGSPTPGHPEYGHTPGVETTTGPLGQGVANGVGMAIAERSLAARFNRPGHEIFDQHVYAICSDGDLMEGVASEAASLAGHLRLGRLVYFWDDNRITIDGSTDLSFTEDVLKRFDAYGWHILSVEDGNDLEAMDEAIRAAKADDRPTMIRVRTVIGYGSPNKAGTSAAHGAPLGDEEISKTKEQLGWTEEPFTVPDAVRSHMGRLAGRGRELRSEWEERFAAYRDAHPDLADELRRRLERRLPEQWDAGLSAMETGSKVATRAASGTALNAIASKLPELMGGSADLAGSNNTMVDGEEDFGPHNLGGRNMYFGVREHAMGSVMNGMALYGGFRPYGGTFLIFSDYMRPAIRLAALMKQPTIYVFTHDSVGLGEDGPTHQPVEQLAALRAIPGLVDLRPADGNETVEAWRFAAQYTDGPLFMALTRQKVPTLEGTAASREGFRRGAYVLSDSEGEPEIILMATGSEVSLIARAAARLREDGRRVRVVSMPSWALFGRQDRTYRDEVLPPAVTKRLAVETGSCIGWHEWLGAEGDMISIDDFGHSAPFDRIFDELGFRADHVVERAEALLEGRERPHPGQSGKGPTRYGVDERTVSHTSKES